MPSYQERSQQNKAIAEQQYFDALKQRDRLADGKEKMQILAPDGETGRYLISRSDGGVTSNGDKIFNAAPPSDGFVRPSKNPHSNAIALDHRNVKRTQFLPTEETTEDSTSNVIFLFRDSETRDGIVYFTFWVGGDRSEPEQIYECAEPFEDTTLEFIHGSIQKTGLNLNSFVVNLIFKKAYVAPVPLVDLTEPITYFLYKIEGLDNPDVDTEVLTDDLLVDNVYEGSLSLKKQELVLPRYPERSVPKLLQDGEATLSDRGFYEDFKNGSFAFQYGYFASFEIGKGTISEVRSGEWHNIEAESGGGVLAEFPPRPSLLVNGILDSLPQFDPDNLKHQKEPYNTLYDYTQVKYTYDPDNPENPPYVPPFTGGQMEGILYTVTVRGQYAPRFTTTLTETYTTAGIFAGKIRGVEPYYYPISPGFAIFSLKVKYSVSAEFLLGGWFTTDSPINTIDEILVTRQDGLPDTGGDLPPGANNGCIDTDANNYAEIDDPSKPDHRTSETCTYNPYRVRGNQRVAKVNFLPETEESPTPLAAPVITPTEQNLTIPNPIKKLVDNGAVEVLSTNNYAVQTEDITTTEKITVTYFPPVFPDLQSLSADAEFLDTQLLSINYDESVYLTKKTSKYPQEIQDEWQAIKDADPSTTITVKNIADQYSTVVGGTVDYSYEAFKLAETFFNGDSNTDGKNIFDEQFYLPNYALDSTLFIVSKKFNSEGSEIAVGDGDTIDVVQTILGGTVNNTPLSTDFIGDTRGQIVDASAYFEV
jgi:hypothetical protein